VYLSELGSSTITALRLSDGQALWQTDVLQGQPGAQDTQQALEQTPFHLLASPEQLFVGFAPGVPKYDSELDTPHLLTALRASDGARLWSVMEPKKYAFQIAGSVGYVLTDAWLEAIQLSDGTSLWQKSLQAASMLVDGAALYVGMGGFTGGGCWPPSEPTRLLKLRASDGTLLWQKQA
jgi:hypothetical protein